MSLHLIEYEHVDGSIRQTFAHGEFTCGMFISRHAIGPDEFISRWSVYDWYTGAILNNQPFDHKKQAKIFTELICTEFGWAMIQRRTDYSPELSKNDIHILQQLERTARS